MNGSPLTGSFYSVVTFLLLAGAFTWGMDALAGWHFPTENRFHMTVALMYFLAAGGYAFLVGRHRDVGFGEALRRGLIDAGRYLKGKVMR
jgi:hypothetical protein